MKTILLSLFLIMVAGAADEPSAVFTKYRDAILEGKGKEAVECLSEKTIKYYADMINKALKAKREEVEKMTIMDKLMVFSLRVRIEPKELKKLDGKKLLVYSVDKGWINKDSVQNFKEFKVQDDPGTENKVMVVKKGDRNLRLFKFYKEKDQWKVDVTSINAMLNLAMKVQFKQIDENEDKALIAVLGSLVGRKVSIEEVYKPIENEPVR